MKTLKLTDHFKKLRKLDPMLNNDNNWINQSYFAICHRSITDDILSETLYTCTEEGTVDMPDDVATKYISTGWLEEVI